MRPWMLMLSLLLAAPAQASPRPLVSLQVVDREQGHVLPEHLHGGQRWIAGVPGHRYRVRLQNHGAERVLVVLSVDGVNAVSGQTASTSQTGYVLEPWQQTEIAGWRKSLHDVAGFEFTALRDSYAARTGRPDNVGVIGVAVFRERAHPAHGVADAIARETTPHAGSRHAEADAASRGSEMAGKQRAPSAASVAPQESLGTAHGAREWSHARRVEFERAEGGPHDVQVLRYDSRENLMAMGVIASPPAHRVTAPDPFPIGFVPDPRD